MTEKDAATVLEEAADLLLIHGRCREAPRGPNGERCVLAAIGVAYGSVMAVTESAAWAALAQRIPFPVSWNWDTEDDFEVIDTLRSVAKQLRNGETS